MYNEKLNLAECPHCGKKAFGYDIEKKFGYRTCDNKPQSWCRVCRSYKYDIPKRTNKEVKAA